MAGAVALPSSIGAAGGGSFRLLCSSSRDDPPSTSCSRSHNHLRLHALPRSSFFAWDARSHLGFRSQSLALARDWLRPSKRKVRGVVQASLLGVGAPEALVIAVVALLVFGPKGLAEVARTLGKSFRAFQPTIRELQQISRDFKDTLEQEIGLDEIRSSETKPPRSGFGSNQQVQPTANQNGPVEQKAYSTEDYSRITEEQAKALVPEEERQAAEAAAWGGSPPKVNIEASGEQNKSSDGVVNNAAEAAAWGGAPPKVNTQASGEQNKSSDGVVNNGEQ